MNIDLLKTFIGVTLISWICIILGSGAYMLDKYYEQYLKAKAKGTTLKFFNYLFSPESWIPLLLSIIIVYFLALGAGEYIGIVKSTNPNVMAALWGLFAYVGYSHLRKRILGNKYLKNSKE